MSTQRILYLTAPEEDFLADSLLHGLRTVMGSKVVDYPRCVFLDDDLPTTVRARMHGKGFTLYGTRPKAEGDAIDRTHVWRRVRSGEFSKVVFSAIWRQYGFYLQNRDILTPENTVMIDGEDVPTLFPYSSALLRQPDTFSLLRVYRRCKYFKRELCPQSLRSVWFKAVPERLATWFGLPPTVHPISFSIPEERIAAQVPEKRRLMFPHCVDAEAAALIPGLSTTPPFRNEQDYHQCLAESRFAVTTKRSGWDCLRHYEIAANGCVACFRKLGEKAPSCAPHGLNQGNCLEYSSPAELVRRTAAMDDDEYQRLAEGSLRWARQNSTRVRAAEFLRQIGGE
jgi:hypothetical protein